MTGGSATASTSSRGTGWAPRRDGVGSWVGLLSQALDEEALTLVAAQIRGADISADERARLTGEYKAAQARIKAL